MAAKDTRADVPQAGNPPEPALARATPTSASRGEALEERRLGNEEEAEFELAKARELDGGAVDRVLKGQAKQQG